MIERTDEDETRQHTEEGHGPMILALVRPHQFWQFRQLLTIREFQNGFRYANRCPAVVSTCDSEYRDAVRHSPFPDSVKERDELALLHGTSRASRPRIG